MSKLAILVPEPVNGVALESVVNLAASLAEGKAGPKGLEVVLSLPFEAYTTEALRKVRATAGVQLRDFGIELVTRKFVRSFFDWRDKDYGGDVPLQQFARPIDKVGGYDFLDCDHWLLWNTPDVAPVPSLRPYAAGLHDALRRGTGKPGDMNVPFNRMSDQAVINRAWTLRAAKVCFAATPHMRGEATDIYGVPKRNVCEAGHVLAVEKPGTAAEDMRIPLQRRPYILVPVAVSALESLGRVGEVIERYFMAYSGELDIVMIGAPTRLMGQVRGLSHDAAQEGSILVPEWDKDQLEAFKIRIARWNRRFQNKLSFYSDGDDVLRRRLVMHAAAVWLPQLCSDRDLMSIEAARLGVPIIAAKVPVLQELAGIYGVKAAFHDGWEPSEACARLVEVEQQVLASKSRGGWKPSKDMTRTVLNQYGAVLERLMA